MKAMRLMIPLPRPAALLALLTALLFPAVLRAETVLSFPGNPAAPGALLLSPDPSGFSFGRTNDFAVEMFLMLEGSGAATETVFANMPVSNTLATGGPGWGLYAQGGSLRVYGTSYEYPASQSGVRNVLMQPVNVSTGKWHHVVVNFVRNSSVDLYVDGALVQKVGQPVYNFDSTNSYRVGLSPLGGHPFFGKVDELRIWERARTPTEIRRAAETKPALGSTEKSLRLYYSFNESDGVALSVGPVQSGLPAELRGISRVQDASLVLGPPLPPPTDFALAFNGVNQSARTAIDGALLAGDEFTIEYWFKGRRLQSAVRLQPTNGSTWMVSGHGAPAQVNNLVNPGTGNVSARVDSVFAVNDGVIWHHVALTWQRGTANGLRSYLDGVLRGSGNTDATPFPVIAAPIWLGSFNGTSEFMDGAIDEVRIWKRVLPPSEIEQHARDVRRLSGDERGLAAYFDFNDQDAAGPLDLVSGKRGTFSNTGAGAYVPTDLVYGEPLPNPQAAAGLWLGEVSLRAVSEVSGGPTNTVQAGGVFDFNIILHADSNGVVRLLKDVTIMQKRNAASNLTEIVLLTDEGLIPNFDGVIKRAGKLVGMRYSSAFTQFDGQSLLLDGVMGYGGAVAGTNTISATQPGNPFFHKYHPQHRNPTDLKGNGYSISRQLQIIFDSRRPNTVVGRDRLTGKYRETFVGLHKVPITAEGEIQLQRISLVNKLNNQ